jgi:hypothetical protein
MAAEPSLRANGVAQASRTNRSAERDAGHATDLNFVSRREIDRVTTAG